MQREKKREEAGRQKEIETTLPHQAEPQGLAAPVCSCRGEATGPLPVGVSRRDSQDHALLMLHVHMLPIRSQRADPRGQHHPAPLMLPVECANERY